MPALPFECLYPDSATPSADHARGTSRGKAGCSLVAKTSGPCRGTAPSVNHLLAGGGRRGIQGSGVDDLVHEILHGVLAWMAFLAASPKASAPTPQAPSSLACPWPWNVVVISSLPALSVTRAWTAISTFASAVGTKKPGAKRMVGSKSERSNLKITPSAVEGTAPPVLIACGYAAFTVWVIEDFMRRTVEPVSSGRGYKVKNFNQEERLQPLLLSAAVDSNRLIQYIK